ncbi:MAG TPA: GTP cyclohydrolase FolE2 [Xanthomonadaceae bacterium]|jgi:GTP cyclohydrolase I|nr:GTP cyclohydrolase FolE2 [Xanthomonadaceae bacterium]
MSTDHHHDPMAAARVADEAANALPDIASDQAASDALDWVGMDAIDLPVRVVDGGVEMRVAASVSTEVDLRGDASRGIHMSRLYLALDAACAEPLSPAMLHALLRGFLASHVDLSTRARVRIAFDHFLRRPALASGHSGWRRYPMVLTAMLERDAFTLDVAFDVVYSSTCPASTALARQLVAEDFGRAFPADAPLDRAAALRWLSGEHGMRATPHSQRSTAHIRVRLDRTMAGLPFGALIDRAEAALGTAVQTAVKRIDEQAFARRNGENPMFCEDAARRLQRAFTAAPVARELGVRGIAVRVAHHESLHAHDAVASIGDG